MGDGASNHDGNQESMRASQPLPSAEGAQPGAPEVRGQTDAARSARSSARAAWVAVTLALLVFAYNAWSDLNNRQEILNVDATRYFGDYPTTLTEWLLTPEGPSGLVAVLWDVLVANNGNQSVSITAYEVREVVGTGGALASYTGLDQGLLDRSLDPVRLPFTLSPGEARRVFLRTGLKMAPAAFQAAREEFGIAQPLSMESIRRLLFANGLDIYGNPVTEPVQGVWSVDADSRREQFFEIAFHTGRESAFRVPVSWYAISGLGR